MKTSTKASVKPLSLAYLYYLENLVLPCIKGIQLEAWEKTQAAFLLTDLRILRIDLSPIEEQIKTNSLEMFLSEDFPFENTENKNPKQILNDIEKTLWEMSFRYCLPESDLRLFLEGLAEYGCTQYEFRDIAKRAYNFSSKLIDPKQFEFNAIIPLSKELNKPKKVTEVKTSTPLKELISYTDDPNPEEPPDDDAIAGQEKKGKSWSDPASRETEKCQQDVFSDGHYISIDKDLYKFNGRYYEICDRADIEARIIDWARRNPIKTKTGRYVAMHCSPDAIDRIFKWLLKTNRVAEKRINPVVKNHKNCTKHNITYITSTRRIIFIIFLINFQNILA
jgi:hypothetical protein